jgi:hypothetical protein
LTLSDVFRDIAPVISWSCPRIEDKFPLLPPRSLAEMIRKVYEVEATLCPQYRGIRHIIAFLTDVSAVDQIN